MLEDAAGGDGRGGGGGAEEAKGECELNHEEDDIS